MKSMLLGGGMLDKGLEGERRGIHRKDERV